jgi:hypothetical protein
MLDEFGNATSRSMAAGTQILCTDCHNSDDNREFGGAGPNGPHGSKWSHILEHQYLYSTALSPGQPVNTLYPLTDTSVNGPAGMCAKCHDLTKVQSSASWSGHINHLADGFTCSTCHTAHGNPSTSTGAITGERLVNFDLNVVAPVPGNPISYNHSGNTCALVCHGNTHLNGTVTPGTLHRGVVTKK